MLVIISDLHFTDGTTGSTIGASAFRDFRDRLQELAYDASWRDNRAAHALDPSQPDKIYEPIESFDLILLGDVIDIIRSTLWSDNGETIRPWQQKGIDDWDAKMAAKVQEIVDAILCHNHKALTVIRELSAETAPLNAAPNHFEMDGKTVTVDYASRRNIRIPRATAHKQPNPSAGYLDIPARIHYITGNHDWNFVSEGAVYDQIRAATVEAFGLVNDPTRPFPWDLTTEDHAQLASTLQRHDVFVRHGDRFDQYNYDTMKDTRDTASLGDALVIELVNRFPVEVEHMLLESAEDESLFVDSLKEIANVRPMNALPAWLNSLLEGYKASGMHRAMRKRVQQVWNDLVDELLNTELFRQQDTLNPLQSVDKLQALLRASKFVSISRTEGLIELGETVGRIVTSAVDPYAHHAAEEPWLQDGRAKYVVYGHTHGQRVVPLDRKISAENDEKLLYFNCGTWKRLHEQTIFSGDGTRFVDYMVMSYVAFFSGNERSGRPFETWTGTLATKRTTEALS